MSILEEKNKAVPRFSGQGQGGVEGVGTGPSVRRKIMPQMIGCMEHRSESAPAFFPK